MSNRLFRVLVGSQSVNLATPNSDKDFIVFNVPTWNDLYNKTEAKANQYISDTEDITFYDIRKIVDLAKKPNISNLAVFYTDEMKYYSCVGYGKNAVLSSLVNNIFDMRHEISQVNIPKLYEACTGMFLSDKKKYMQDTNRLKAAANAYRDMDFLLRFHKFKDAGEALHYCDNEFARKTILAIKEGMYTNEQIMYMLGELEKHVSLTESWYKEQCEHPIALMKLEELIKQIIKVKNG